MFAELSYLYQKESENIAALGDILSGNINPNCTCLCGIADASKWCKSDVNLHEMVLQKKE